MRAAILPAAVWGRAGAADFSRRACARLRLSSLSVVGGRNGEANVKEPVRKSRERLVQIAYGERIEVWVDHELVLRMPYTKDWDSHIFADVVIAALLEVDEK